MRGLAGGQIFRHIREVVLTVFYPAWRAGGNKRKNAAVLHALDKLMCLLHNGKVGGEIGVKYLVKAQTAQCGSHFAFYIGSDGKPKVFAETCADSRSGLHDNMLFRVRDCCKNSVGGVLFLECTGGTYGDTLSAGNTGGLTKSHAESGADFCGKTAVICADNADSLNMLADSHTAAAENTLAVVANHVGSGGVNLGRCLFAIVVSLIVHAQLSGQLLKLAVSAAHAG